MVIYIIYILIYVFFVYGIIAFTKNIYSGYRIHDKEHKIQILVDNEENLEYILMNLKDKFAPIVLYVDTENEELMKIIELSSLSYNIEYKDIMELKEN